MPVSLSTIPPDFLSGGKGLTPSGSSGDPDVAELLTEIQTALGPTAAGLIQRGIGTLVAGTFTVNTGIVLGADSVIVVSPATRPGTTTNLACIGVTARTNGIAGVASFTVEALVAAGTIDSDAVGTVSWIIVG